MLPFRKFLILLATCLLAIPAHSQQRSAWAFYDVKLSEIVRIGLSQLLNKSFVADDAFIRDERRVTIDLKPDQGENAGAVLIDLLVEAGYKVDNKTGIWKIRKLTDNDADKDKDNETFIYKPKYRNASYFYDVLGIGKASNRPERSNVSRSSSGTGNFSPTVSASGLPSKANSDTGKDTESGASQYIDRTADVVYIRASAKEIEDYTRAIAILDTPEDQVDIAAVVYEFVTTEGSSTAIGAVINFAKGKITGQFGAVQAVGDFLRFDTANLQALFSMIEQDKRFQLISSPNIRVKSGASSLISVGARVPTLGSTTQTSGTVTQSVQYQQTGIVLDVQPTIFRDVIDIKIKQSVSEAVGTDTGVNSSPTLTTREVSTNVTMQDGEAVVLGGLTSTKDNATKTGLSFLPKWARTKSDSKDRTELLIFLRVGKVQSAVADKISMK